MGQKKNKRKLTIQKIRGIIFTPLALIVSLVLALLRISAKKISARGIICDPVHEPPEVCDPVHVPPICDPVHVPPPYEEAAEYVSSKPAISLSVIALLIFPINVYRIMKRFFLVQFSSWQLAKKLLKHCLLWAFGYSLILVILFFTLSFFKPIKFSFYPLWIHVLFIALMFVPAFLLLNFITGIELLMISIKDHRFLKTGVFFTLISGLFLFLIFVMSQALLKHFPGSFYL